MKLTKTKPEAPDLPEHYKQNAPLLLERGYIPIPIVPGEKRPSIKNWTNFEPTWESVERHAGHSPTDGAGIRLDDLLCVDVDSYKPKSTEELSGEDVKAQRQRAWQFRECVREALKANTSDGHFLLRENSLDSTRFAVPLNSHDELRSSKITFWRADHPNEKHVVEILAGRKKQVAVYGRHPDGGSYTWKCEEDPTRGLNNTEKSELAYCSYDALLEAFKQAKKTWRKVVND